MSSPDAPPPVHGKLGSADAVERLGAAIAPLLRIGEALCLFGPLGAGKSTLARGLIRAMTSAEEEVPSPTFTLVQTYETPALPISHFDLYRLKSPEEAFEIGLDEALQTGAVIIEWPERLVGDLPQDRLDIALRHDGEGRAAVLTGWGAWVGRTQNLETYLHD
jgi:tRNA threonylcarbamoyladenosine biosynthesis protein TsaE